MKRWLAAASALAASVAVTASLLVFADPARGAVEVAVAARDISAGTAIDSGSIVFVRASVTGGEASLFTRRDARALYGLQASHDLLAGQLVQHADVEVAGAVDLRLVFVPVKDVPPVSPGSSVDLLAITGGPDHTLVQPFAVGVEVRAVTSTGLVVAVPAGKAAAFVYAGASMQLAAVVAEPGAARGAEMPVGTDQEAMAVAGSQ